MIKDMTGLNNQSYLFEFIRRPTNDETNKDKDNKQTKIVRGSHNTYNLTSSIESVVVP